MDILGAAIAPTITSQTIREQADLVKAAAEERGLKDLAGSLQGMPNYSTLNSDDRQQVQHEIADIKQLFEAFLNPEPAAIFQLGKTCNEAAKKIEGSPAHGQLIGLKSKVDGEFKGTAADKFFANYIDVQQTIKDNQVDAIKAVVTGINYDGMIFHQARASINDIAIKTIDALKDDAGSDDLKVALLVLGAVAAIAAAVATGGTSISAYAAGNASLFATTATTGTAALSAFSASAYNTKGVVDEEAKASKDVVHGMIRGNDMKSILDSMRAALQKVRSDIEAEQDGLNSRIYGARQALHNMWKGYESAPENGGKPAPPDVGTEVDGKPVNLLVVNQPGGV